MWRRPRTAIGGRGAARVVMVFVQLLSFLAVPTVASYRALRNGTTMENMAAVAFFGYDIPVPGGAGVTLTFTPSFGKSKAQPTGQDKGLIVRHVLSNQGRDVIVNSTCGALNNKTGLYQGDSRCVWNVVKWVIERNPRTYVAAPTIDGPTVLFGNKSGAAVTYSAWTMDNPKGFYFTVLSHLPVAVTLTQIKITGSDFKSMVSLPDIVLPASA